jgi:FMN phosphatase YigB (HAD superfamily)
VELTSFDVFDTLLTRRVGDPHAVFLLLGDQLSRERVVACTPEVFARARVHAEAVLAADGHQPPLAEIHRELTRALGLPGECVDRLVAAEQALEERLVVPVPGAVTRVERARGEGRVAFVSDMYLPTAFVTSLLDRHGLRRDGELVLVSGDVRASKAAGDLFDVLCARTGTTPDRVVHVGDHPDGDLRRPRERGLATRPLTDARLNRYEAILEDFRWPTAGASSLLAGASRLARLEQGALDPRERAIVDVTAGVVGPFLVGYVLWVLHRASELGVERLHFVARDGEVLLDLARALAPAAGVDLDLRYLHGSRHAWACAGLDPHRPEQALAASRVPDDDSLAAVLDRCGVDPGRWGADATLLPPAALDAALERLRRDPAFLHAVGDGVAARQERLDRYLRQQGLYDDVADGVVDVGWYGRSLDGLARRLRRERLDGPVGFYIGLHPRGEITQRRECWLYDGMWSSSGPTGLPSMHEPMIETFCSGRHGQVIDYRIDGGRTVPVLHEERNELAERWGLDLVRATVTDFAHHVAAGSTLADLRTDLRAPAVAVFRAFHQTPTRAEAQIWGDFPFERTTDGGGRERLARPRTLVGEVRARRPGAPLATGWWQGEMASASRPWRAAYRSASGTRRGVRGVARRLDDWRRR